MRASHPPPLLRSFRRKAKRRRRSLDERFGVEATDGIIERAESEYASMSEEIEAIPKGLMNGALAGTYEYLAYAKALRAEDVPDEDIGAFFSESWNDLVPGFAHVLGPIVFRLARPFIRSRIRKEAAQSAAAPGDGGWRFDFAEPESGSHDFGMDVTNCAVCELYSRHDAVDLVPYLCALDDKMSTMMGMGLQRSNTRALGGECCDFRYKAGGQPKPLSLPVVD